MLKPRCVLQRVFAVGDKLSAFLIDVDEKNQVEFSTMELETYPGEVLNDMVRTLSCAIEDMNEHDCKFHVCKTQLV